MTDNKIAIDLLVELENLGLTREEALLYLHLLRVKSATASNIHQAEEFHQKKRPNIYKLLNRLVEKDAIYTEQKEGKTLYFPSRPHVFVNNMLDDMRNQLRRLEETLPLVDNRLEEIHSTQSVSLEEIDSEIYDFIMKVIPQKWIIREKPFQGKIGGSGKQISIEFNTRRRFSGDAAGLIIYSFRYPKHIEHFSNSVINSMKEGMISALESQKGEGRFDIKHYEFSEASGQPLSDESNLKYTRSTVYLNLMNMKGEGGFLSLKLIEFPNWIVGIWAATIEDLKTLLNSVTSNFDYKTD